MKHIVRAMEVNSTTTPHICAICGRQIQYGAKMKILVTSTRTTIHNDYYCMICAEKNKELFEEVANV